MVNGCCQSMLMVDCYMLMVERLMPLMLMVEWLMWTVDFERNPAWILLAKVFLLQKLENL